MGGHACVLYGAAEFGRDLDLLVLADPESLKGLEMGLAALEAERIAVPPFDSKHLTRGHAIHFRCHRADVAGLLIDIMSQLRGVAPFEELWRRRSTIESDGEPIDVLAIEDLVRAKKTQRDKDWPMISRLVERSYFSKEPNPPAEPIRFWLRELRSADLLIEVSAAFPEQAALAANSRSALASAIRMDPAQTATLLIEEEKAERERDRQYWAPLKRELETLRRRGGAFPP